MKTTFKQFKVFTAGVILVCLMSTVSHAQDQSTSPQAQGDIIRVETITFDDPDKDEDVSGDYITVPDSVQMSTVHELFYGEDYPMVILKGDVVVPGIQAIQNLLIQRSLFNLRDRHWATLDSINAEKINQYKIIIDLQDQRIANFDSANVMLNEQIVQLNNQLDESYKLTERSLGGRVFRNITNGILGAALGFSVAILIRD